VAVRFDRRSGDDNRCRMRRVHPLWIASVVLAAILLVVYLDRYRSRVEGENAPATVLVAKQLIPQGTPGRLVASQSMYAPTTLPPEEVEVGAISDPAYLSGRTVVADIFPGQQLTATDFAGVRRVGPAYVVASGDGWKLFGWKKDNGLCVSPQRPAANRGLCFSQVQLAGAPFACFCGQPRHGRMLALGVVKASTRHPRLVDRLGTRAVAIYASPEALATSFRFFRVVAHTGSPPRWRLDFFDRSGGRAGTVGQGF
jgi:hypothetical protein